MTDSEQEPGSTLTPIGRAIIESGMTHTAIAEAMSRYLSGATKVQRQTVTHYERDPIARMPAPEMMRSLGRVLGVPPRLILHLFVVSHELHYRALMGITEGPARDQESTAHSWADRLDDLPDTEDRRQILWTLRTLIEAREQGTVKEPDMADGRTAGDRLRQLGDRIIEEIGAGATEADAQAAIDLLAQRKKAREKEQSD